VIDMPAHPARRSTHLGWLAVVAIVTFLGTMAVLVLVRRPTSPQSLQTIASQPASAAWCFVVAAQVAMWAALLMPLVAMVRHYALRARDQVIPTLILAVVLLAAFTLFMATHQHAIPDNANFPVDLHKEKVKILTPIGFGVALLCMVGMRFAGRVAEKITASNAISLADADEFIIVSQDLDWLLSISGLVIGAATLATGLLRQALRALNASPELLPAIGVFTYGAFGSALIAAVYLPAYANLVANGQRLVTALLPTSHENVGEWLRRADERLKLEIVLGINKTWWESLKGRVAIIAPLVASAASVFVPFK
jgi:hypothetical protein